MSIILLLLCLFAAYEMRQYKTKRALFFYNSVTYIGFAVLAILTKHIVSSFGLGAFFDLVVTIICYVHAAAFGSLFFRQRQAHTLVFEGIVLLVGFTLVGLTLAFWVGLF